MSKPSVRISSVQLLEGIRFGFYFPSKGRIFVSPALHKLIEDDLDLMRQHVRCYVMPTDKETGDEVYSSLEEWVGDLLARGADINVKPKHDPNKHRKEES